MMTQAHLLTLSCCVNFCIIAFRKTQIDLSSNPRGVQLAGQPALLIFVWQPVLEKKCFAFETVDKSTENQCLSFQDFPDEKKNNLQRIEITHVLIPGEFFSIFTSHHEKIPDPFFLEISPIIFFFFSKEDHLISIAENRVRMSSQNFVKGCYIHLQPREKKYLQVSM